MRVPVHIVSGFLGTGKTTLLLDQLEQREGERIGIVVNDFGDASIDRTTLETRGPVALSEIRGACVCCTAPEGFSEAMRVLLDEVRPERIFVEPTGLARPSDLIDTLTRGPHRDRVVLGPLVVVVDPHAFDPADLDPRARDAVEAADVLVANRLDLATASEIARFDAWAAARWPAPLAVWRTTHGRVPKVAFEWPAGEGPRAPHDHDHDHDHGDDPVATARSFTWAPDVVFEAERLRAVATALASGGAGAPLLRLKGLFRTRDGTVLVEVAGGRLHERPSPWRRDSRVDVIVSGDADLDAVGHRLDEARATEAELRLDPEQIEVVRPDATRVVLDRSAVTRLAGVPDVGVRVPGRKGAAASVGDLLRHVGAPDDAIAIVVAADGFASPPVPVATLLDGLLVHTIDGAPLPAAQGGPFRLLIPDAAGPAGPCSNVKGVVRIVLRAPVPLRTA